MLRYLACILSLSIAASAWAGDDNPAGQAPSSAQIRQQYAAYLARSVKERTESHARGEKIMARSEAILARQEQMMKRQEEDIARFEKILTTWERQQAQYQKYLDSLQKKQ